METGSRRFNRSHEWIEALGDKRYRIGISDYAQETMGDVVFVDLPDEGDELRAGESFAEAESVKAVSEIFSPVNGIGAAVNEELDDNPAAVNESPYEAWLVEAEDSELAAENGLMTEEEYLAYVAELD